MKKRIVIIGALLSALALAAQTGVGRPAIAAMEKGLDGQFANLWPGEPFLVIGTTRGLCLDGYGAVFTTELNLVQGPLRTPMSPEVPDKGYIAQFHDKKLERVTRLRDAMRTILAQTASSLDNLPPEQQVVLEVTLSRYPWENRDRIPAHIVMQGRRTDLLQAKAGGPALEQAVKVQEY